MLERLAFPRTGLAIATAALVALAAGPPAHADEPTPTPGAPPQLFLVHQEVVDPAMVGAYEQATKDFFGFIGRNRATMPSLQATGFATDEMEYIYLVPLANFAALDTMMSEFMAMEGAQGEQAAEWQRLMKEGGRTTRQIDEWLVLQRPDLGYEPAEPRVPMGERTAFRLDFYSIQNGMTAEAEALSKEIADLYRRKGIRDGFQVYQAVFGSDMPFYVVSFAGRDELDVATAMAGIEKTLGEEWAPYQERLMGLTRALRTERAWLRPDLSLALPASE